MVHAFRESQRVRDRATGRTGRVVTAEYFHLVPTIYAPTPTAPIDPSFPLPTYRVDFGQGPELEDEAELESAE